MSAYQTIAIDQEAFFTFLQNPSPALLDKFVKALSSNDDANDFFEEVPPVWSTDPSGWVTHRLTLDDWYGDLSEGEALAWDSAIGSMWSQFKPTTTVQPTEHGAIHHHIFELAEEMFQGDRAAHQMLRMTPYRYHKLADEIENAEPYDRIYWPTHAMLDTEQLSLLEQDLLEFKARLADYEISSSDVFNSIDERRSESLSESNELLKYIGRLQAVKAMWYARIDC